MKILYGKSVYGKIAEGRLAFYRRREPSVVRRTIGEKDRQGQWQRYIEAKQEAASQLEALYDETKKILGQEEAAVFEMQKILLDDCEYADAMHRMIFEQGVNPEYAVRETGERMAAALEELEDPYIRERAQDVRDISTRLLNVLDRYGQENKAPREPGALGGEAFRRQEGQGVIIAAQDLTPSETVWLADKDVRGFVLRGGSVNSHTAILARTMGVPALFGLGSALEEEDDGTFAVIDAEAGRLYLSPDEKSCMALREKREQEDKRQKQLLKLKGLKNVTLGGRQIAVYANAGNLEDIDKAVENDAGGIGLLRSEILYLGRDRAPDEETQLAFYRRALLKMPDREVVIRTLDVGADKQAPCLQLKKEENPALGLRGIRVCLKNPELFKTQLRALYRAGIYGNLRILYPMLTSTEELRRLIQIEEQVKGELSAQGTAFADKLPRGIMIETPGAALISDELARMADFFSIGTNDLTQYTLALDRQNPEVEDFGNPHHRAVLELIRITAENAAAAGIPAAVCGELAGDTGLTEELIRMGVSGLSVPPAMVLPLRMHIRGLKI